jgi:hypothetical protein
MVCPPAASEAGARWPRQSRMFEKNCDELIPNGSEKLTNLFKLAKKSDELIPNGSVELVPITQKCVF